MKKGKNLPNSVINNNEIIGIKDNIIRYNKKTNSDSISSSVFLCFFLKMSVLIKHSQYTCFFNFYFLV